jgi:hypothetical protein
MHAPGCMLQESREANAKLHAEASSLRGQLDTANKLLAAPDKPALDNALHMALQVCAAAAIAKANAPAAGVRPCML